MNQCQRIHETNAADRNQFAMNARQRLTPAHIALAPLQSPETTAPFANAHVSTSASVGRHVVTDQLVKQGTAVLVERPYVHEIDEKWIGKRCSFCFNANVSIRCRQCTRHRYCSTACEHDNWTIGLHSVFCSLCAVLDTDHILALKAYLKSMSSHRSAPLCFNTATALIPHLASNFEHMSEADIREYTHGATACAELFYWPASSISALVHVMAQIRCNRFAIKANVMTKVAGIIEHVDASVGSAVYLQASMFNHSCTPNAFATFDGTQITVRCSEDVQSNSEINISYGPLASRLSRSERQRELAEKYLFQCCCKGCIQSEQQVHHGLAYCCPSWDGSWVYRGQKSCAGCGQHIDWANIDQEEKKIAQLKHFATTDKHLLKIVELEKRLYGPHSLQLGATYDGLAQMYAHHQDFMNAAKYCSLSLGIVEHHYGKVSIESAEEHFKLASLLFNAFNRTEAYKATNTCIQLWKRLGLDQARKEDMQELKEMMHMLEL